MENKKIRILCDHQTGYLPWLGLFHRISLSDIYVSLDTVKYNPRSYDSRNKIKTPNGFKWLNVPVLKGKSELLKDIKINNAVNWKEDHLKAISHSYGATSYFDYYFNKIKSILDKKHEFLMDLNEELLKFFLNELRINVDFVKASHFDVVGQGNQYLINLCKALGANIYVFGQLGKGYADAGLWKKNSIKIFFHQYSHPIYKQRFNNFEPFLSVLDLLFNEGAKNALKTIGKNNITRKEMLLQLQ